jgi:FtsH-binding integral membrane protein
VNTGSWIELSLKTAFGPQYAVTVDDPLVYEAYMLSAILFGIFTVAGMIATPGMLFICILVVGVGSFISFWTWIGAIFGLVSLLTIETVVIRGGIAMFSAYILLDTYVIYQQAKAGVRDVVSHAITLLTDFLQLFVRIVYLLAKSKLKEKK